MLTSSPLLVSSFYVSAPQHCPAGVEDFINAVAGLIPEINETPFSLLKKLQEIESEAARKRSGVQNEARTLDLDLITFQDYVCNDEKLILPHPRAHERRFVLEPLVEISGDWAFPGAENTTKELLSLNKEQGLEILAENSAYLNP